MSHSLAQTGPTLRRRLIVQLCILMMGSVALAVAAIVGIGRMHEDHGLAIRGYQQLREACEIGFNLAQAQSALRTPGLGPARARHDIDAAVFKLRDAKGWLESTRSIEAALLLNTSNASSQLRADHRAAAELSLQQATARLAEMLASVRMTVTRSQDSAAAERQRTVALIAIVSVLVIVGSTILAVHHYRGIMRPIDRLSAGLRELARGDLARRVDEIGDREFVGLSRDFNGMAAQLQDLCEDLTRKVEIKSRELTRSERLASVGYLAAGVAHEINNPLAIIAGYAERSLQQFRRENGSPQLERSLGIICEESFRCKSITHRLLTLARPGAGGNRRGRVSIAVIAQDVIDNLTGLRIDSSARVRLIYAPDDDLHATVNEDEIKQVLLNLLLNALSAVRANGQVDVTVSRVDHQVQIAVADDGAGMTCQTLERVFEPFFSQANGIGPRGTGLGLSITHAIVLDHGGSIRAESAGAGCGSRFIVSLPVLTERAEAEVPYAAA